VREYEGNIWTRQTWETDTQYSAFLAYRDVGANRSIDAAFKVHSESKKTQKGAKKAQKGAKKDQKKSLRANGTFRGWAKDNDWVKRASEYDVSVQEELDAVKLEALKDAEVEFVQNVKKAAMDATLKILQKSSLEKIRKKYVVDKEGRQILVEMTTEQQSILGVESFVRYALESTIPEIFGKNTEQDSGNSAEHTAELWQTMVSSTGGSFAASPATSVDE
jgi:hypothetical protein